MRLVIQVPMDGQATVGALTDALSFRELSRIFMDTLSSAWHSSSHLLHLKSV